MDLFMVYVQVLESVQFIKMNRNPYANNFNYMLPRCKRETRYCHGDLEKVFKYSSMTEIQRINPILVSTKITRPY